MQLKNFMRKPKIKHDLKKELVYLEPYGKLKNTSFGKQKN